ncbi:MAG: glycosyltransferase [Planctomycetales bacterium]|nr:glycosyltransferase [Planctomycetales bacterium]
MPNSISIILPVRDAELTIIDQVERLLEMLPDFTQEFDLLIIDDGSSDLTGDLASEMARSFPQIQVISHRQAQGYAAAVETGMARTRGEYVFVADINASISATDLRRLWEMRHDSELVLAKALVEPKPIGDHLMNRLMAWGDALKRNDAQLEISSREDESAIIADALASIQMLRRSAIESLAQVAQPEERLRVERGQRTSTVRLATPAAPPTPRPFATFATGIQEPIEPEAVG